MFIDETTFRASAGDGGNGCVAFRREKFVPRGGPFGGDGGDGGNVVLKANEGLSTLFDLHLRHHVKAKRGQHGMGKEMHGRNGADVVLDVPCGTLVYDDEGGRLLGDLQQHEQRLVIARGGRGGLGNSAFKNATRQAPDFAKPGRPGESLMIRLELKLLADVGIIGLPSVGKSTLISRISNSRPKIAEYPFTTLVPNLGMVNWKPEKSFVVADLPGLIKGAHLGKGLGHRFLKHLERTRLIVHLVEVPIDSTLTELADREPIADYLAIRTELEAFNPRLAELPEIVALNKRDLPSTREREDELRREFEQRGVPFVSISAAALDNIEALLDLMGRALERMDGA